MQEAREKAEGEQREFWEWVEQTQRRAREIEDDIRQMLCRLGLGTAYDELLAVLGLTPPVTREEIKDAYRKLAKVHQPDAGGNAKTFMRIETAYRAVLERT
jgi:hypothetical protein